MSEFEIFRQIAATLALIAFIVLYWHFMLRQPLVYGHVAERALVALIFSTIAACVVGGVVSCCLWAMWQVLKLAFGGVMS